MSEQKYYVFQKSVDGKEIVSQLVRFKFMGENAKFMPVSKSKSCRYENSFSEFTKKELAEMMGSTLYKRADYCEFMELPPDWVMNDKNSRWLCEWFNPLIELVPVEGNE